MKAAWVVIACLAAGACGKKTPARWTELHLLLHGACFGRLQLGPAQRIK